MRVTSFVPGHEQESTVRTSLALFLRMNRDDDDTMDAIVSALEQPGKAIPVEGKKWSVRVGDLMQDDDDQQRCAFCGSSDIEERYWLNVRTQEPQGSCEDSEYYCPECGETHDYRDRPDDDREEIKYAEPESDE